MYVPASVIRQKYSISRSTLVSWASGNLVRIKRLPGGKRIYASSDVDRLLGEDAPQKEKIIYARVSSSKQKEDLDRQIEELRCSYPGYVVYKDIGSGLNYKRQRFAALLGRVYWGLVSEIAVTYRDRLCRYGFELVESFCSFHGTKIVVHNAQEADGSDQTELAEDLLAMCNFFFARSNGRRGGKGRKRLRNASQTNKAKPVSRVEEETSQMDGDNQMDL